MSCKINTPVYLRPDEKSSRFHNFLEHFVFWRLSKFKNDPRGNYLLIRSFLIVFSVFIFPVFCISLGIIVFEYLGKIENVAEYINLRNGLKVFFTFLGSTTVSYWNMNNLFNKKWTYCANLYNKVAEFSSSKNGGDANELLENTLAIDLLTLDLWAHRSFADHFSEELWLAVNDKYKDPGIIDDICSKINKKELKEHEAWDLITFRHSHLIK